MFLLLVAVDTFPFPFALSFGDLRARNITIAQDNITRMLIPAYFLQFLDFLWVSGSINTSGDVL